MSSYRKKNVFVFVCVCVCMCVVCKVEFCLFGDAYIDVPTYLELVAVLAIGA